MHSVQLLSRTRNKGKQEEDAITAVIICVYVERQPFPGIKDGEVPAIEKDIGLSLQIAC